MKIRFIALVSFFLFPLAHLSANAPIEAATKGTIDLFKVFQGAPVIYILLFGMSIASFSVWIYSLLTLRLSEMMPKEFLNHVRELLAEQRFEAALASCQQDDNFCSSIIASGIGARKHGSQVMRDAMHSEGRRSGSALWQRISLLNEIAVIAPMLGLLGTVIGLFFAFYDTTRSAESIATLFDGLGIAVGTTVAGLIVALISMIFYTSLKYKLVKLLNAIENETMSLINVIEMDFPRDAKK